MKKIFIIIILLCLQSVATEAVTMQHYINGTIEHVTGDSITVNGNTYSLSPKVSIRAHEKRDNSMYEVAGKTSEMTAGAQVYIRVEGTTVHEVIIERSKK
jgi:hypothetical protein